MRITIIAVGTRGDVQPAIALGTALQKRGYQIRLLASASFRTWIEGHGLEAAQTAVDIQALMESDEGIEWVEKGHNPLAQIRLMKRMLDRTGWQMAWDAWLACQGADAVISSLTSDTYVMAIAAKLNIPQISMFLQPPLYATREGAATMNAPLPRRHSLVNRWFGKIFIERFPWQVYGELSTRLYRELGVAPPTARSAREARRAVPTLLAYSRHIVPHAHDWPANVHTTGYWFLDEAPSWTPPADLAAFLDAGPKPVYIGFGSMTERDPAAGTRLILAAVARSGQRAILAAGWGGLGRFSLSETVFPIAEAPHSRLFPRMAAVVHHGGAGTTAAGLRAGIPTLIVPRFADQPFWGERVHALGAGPAPVPRNRLTVDALTQAIVAAVSDPDIRARAGALGALIQAEDGLARALSLIDGYLDP